MDDLIERPQNWWYRGEDQIAEELRAIAKDLPWSQRQMHLEMAAQIVEQGQFLHPNDFGMAIENADLCARIAALEADNARLMGLVKTASALADSVDMMIERAGYGTATAERQLLAKIKETPDAE